MLRGVIGALIGGLVGGVIWFCIGYFAEVNIGLVAWGVGALVGTGMLLTKRGAPQATSGWVAAGVAVLTLFTAKFAIVDAVLKKKVGGPLTVDREFFVVRFADEIAQEAEDAGKTLDWPQGVTSETAEKPEHYPKDVWKQAEDEWEALSDTEREEQIETLNDTLSDAHDTSIAAMRWEVFFRSYSPFDILWTLLALISAYKFGAGEYGGGEVA